MKRLLKNILHFYKTETKVFLFLVISELTLPVLTYIILSPRIYKDILLRININDIFWLIFWIILISYQIEEE